jgi:hypothetical protein
MSQPCSAFARKSTAQLEHEIAEAATGAEREQDRWLEDEILRAAHRIAGGFDRRVRLSDLRREVVEVGRRELDHALRGLSSRGKIALFPLDDRNEIRTSDVRDAVDLSGVPQHVLYLPSRDLAR